MKKHEKYLEALKEFDDFVTIKEWAEKFKEKYPDDIDDKNENEKIIIRKLVKNITSLVSTGKWSNMLLIDKNNKPQKIKYTTDKQKDDNAQDTHLSQSTKGIKSVSFKDLMKELKNPPDDYDLPRRDDPKYCGDNTIKGIEQLDIYQFNSCMIFEMATRNKDVIEIIHKLDFIEELKDKHPYLEYEGFLFKPLDPVSDNEMQLNIIIEELRIQFEAIAELPISKFIDKLEFLVDTEYSNNYNENWNDDMINDGIADDPFQITDELFKKYKHKSIQGKTFIGDKNLTGGKLNIIFEYLQDKLKYEYFIFPEGYFQDLEISCHEEVISKDLIIENYKLYFNEITDDMNKAIKEFRALKPTHMEEIADIFFIYDYYSKRKADDKLTYCAQDIKSELTKYHGIEIKSLNAKLSYDDCLARYEEFKDLDASFYHVEKTITDKIKLMEEFIDNKLYRFILFY
ncbi:hypothetical protein N5T96_10770 [Aliarcobacter butzleri]|uniref:hypothetical protein n=1 Tax=Aliarcobacter butzleri TaxID=28197 RepID=UPI0021B5A005|nr:hypothetical protein [Aliarcobacter butzleri]MCT7566811.1 hypothetical protein [Aliarcobacter butzleri]